MVGIVTARGDADYSCRELLQAALRRGGGEYVDPLSLSVDVRRAPGLLANGRPITDYDALVLRGLNRSGDIDLQFEVFELAEAMGIPVLNSSRSLSLAESKPTTLYLLAEEGIPVPRTLACQTAEPAREALREFGTAVIKPLFGALGVGVERVHWPDDVDRLESYIEEWRSVCIQEYIPSGGRDIRAFVIGGQVLGAVLRIAQGSEWRTNVHQGGVCEPYELTAREAELCLRATALIGLEYTGVDILPGPAGPLVLEVNGAPQWQGLATATGLDVAGAVIEHALRLASHRRLAVV